MYIRSYTWYYIHLGVALFSVFVLADTMQKHSRITRVYTHILITAGPKVIESPWAKKRVPVEALEALSDTLVV